MGLTLPFMPPAPLNPPGSWTPSSMMRLCSTTWPERMKAASWSPLARARSLPQRAMASPCTRALAGSGRSTWRCCSSWGTVRLRTGMPGGGVRGEPARALGPALRRGGGSGHQGLRLERAGHLGSSVREEGPRTVAVEVDLGAPPSLALFLQTRSRCWSGCGCPGSATMTKSR